MIVVEGVGKSFGTKRAVDSVSFSVRAGEIYGLLGPNGAGKTTTISCVCGLLKPDEGRVAIDGIDVALDPIRARALIGVAPQETAIYETLSARENVDYFAALRGLKGSDRKRFVGEALERVGLAESGNLQSGKFSGGMKRRLNLAIGLVGRPRVLLLDEPTVGIDPQARIHILDVVRSVRAEGTAVLYTTHYLEEAQTLCDRIGIMDHGKILAEGSVAELRRLVGEGTIVGVRGGFSDEVFRDAAAQLSGVDLVSVGDGVAMLAVRGSAAAAPEILGRILQSNLAIDEVSMQEASLESVFIKLTGRRLRD